MLGPRASSPLDGKGIRPRDWHSVARCFTWNKSRMRKSQESGSGRAALLAFYNAVLRTVMRFPKDGSLEKLEFFERTRPSGPWSSLPRARLQDPEGEASRARTYMKQARATRLFHVEQFGAWPADLVPFDEKGNPRLRDRHSVARCFTWNKIRVRKSPTKVRLRGSRTYMKQARATRRLFHVEQFGAWSAGLIPRDGRGGPSPGLTLPRDAPGGLA